MSITATTRTLSALVSLSHSLTLLKATSVCPPSNAVLAGECTVEVDDGELDASHLLKLEDRQVVVTQYTR